jgi:hypothetical protein
MAWCKECGTKVPDDEMTNHAQEIHSELCDEKLQDYITDSVNDAVEELFDEEGK